MVFLISWYSLSHPIFSIVRYHLTLGLLSCLKNLDDGAKLIKQFITLLMSALLIYHYHIIKIIIMSIIKVIKLDPYIFYHKF